MNPWPRAHSRVGVAEWPKRKDFFGAASFEYLPPEPARGSRAIKTSTGIQYVKEASLEAFGGGWVRVDNSMTNVGSIDANGVRRWSWSVGSSCGGYQVYAMDLYVPYTEMLIVYNRISNVSQCSEFTTNTRVFMETGYYTTPQYEERYTPYGMCTWGDFVWAKGTNSSDISGLQNNWVIRLKNSAPGEQVRWRLACHGSSGTTDHTYYVR